jgi:hypothetical protein
VSASQEAPLPLIGRKERVSFPVWDLHRVRAKVDTGAFSSALHVASYELIEDDQGGTLLRMVVCLSRRRPEHVKRIEEPVVKMVKVRSSSGCETFRPLIEPVVRLGHVTRRVRLTVTDRSKMRCRMLLGRHAIAGLFLVDVRARYLLDEQQP